MTARVIIDTSVWIDFFRGKLNQKHKEALTLLLEADEAAITDIIKNELLVGAKTQRDYRFLEDALSALPEFSLSPEVRAEFNGFGFELKLKGLEGKYTDLSIAFLAKKNVLQVFSFDKFFDKLHQSSIIEVLKI